MKNDLKKAIRDIVRGEVGKPKQEEKVTEGDILKMAADLAKRKADAESE